MGGDSVGGELKAWRKILKVSEGLAPKEKEKKELIFLWHHLHEGLKMSILW